VLFKVLRDATKPEIKLAVELLFKVEVESVSTVVQKGKVKKFGRSIGRRDHVKKAYVSLKAGQELNFSGRRVNGRHQSQADFAWPPCRREVVHAHLHKGKPEASLLEPQKQNAGRKTTVTSRFATRAVVTSTTTVSSTSCATRTASRPKVGNHRCGSADFPRRRLR